MADKKEKPCRAMKVETTPEYQRRFRAVCARLDLTQQKALGRLLEVWTVKQEERFN